VDLDNEQVFLPLCYFTEGQDFNRLRDVISILLDIVASTVNYALRTLFGRQWSRRQVYVDVSPPRFFSLVYQG